MQRDDARRLVLALSTLTPRDRDLLTAWHAAGEPLHRLSDRLQLTPDSARNALSRARRRAASAWQQASGLLVALGLWRRRRLSATTSPANQLIAASLAIELGAMVAAGLVAIAPVTSSPPSTVAASMAIGTTTSVLADHLDDPSPGGVPTNGVTTVPSLRRESPPIADAEVVVVTRPEQLPPGEDVRVTVTVQDEEYAVRFYLDDVEGESGQDVDVAIDLGPAA